MNRERRDDEGQAHATLYSEISECKQKIHELQHRLHELEHAEHPSNTVVNIENVTFIGGDMAKLNLVALNAALSKNTSLGDVLDSIYDAIVEAINGANGQAEIDALVAKLEDDNFREDTRVNALKGLVTPATATLAAVWNGPTAGAVGVALVGAVAASGGTAPYTYAQNSGALPDGVTFAADGSVSGAPGTAGEFSFGGSVSDAAGATAQWSGTVSVS